MDRVNIGIQLSRRIKQVRVQHEDKIREKYMQSKTKPPFESSSGPPPPRKAAIPPPRTSAISTEQRTAYTASDLPKVDTKVTYEDYYTNNSDDEKNYHYLETMIQTSVKATHDEASTPFPIVATASANESNAHQDEDINLIPIHADYEDDLTQGQYDAYGGGSTLNF